MVEDKLTFAAIVLVAVVAIVGMLGLSGMPQITGFVAGALNVTISGSLAIALTDNNASIATGYVYANSTQATVNTENTGTNWSVATGTDTMLLNNTGTQKALVNISAGSTAAVFLTSGASQSYRSVAAPSNCTGTQQTAYTALATTETNLCTVFEYVDTADTLTIDYQLVIPVNTTSGAHINVITLTAY